MNSQYQIRRGGVVGPNLYTIEQLSQMFASGALVAADEVSPAGQEQWLTLEFVLAAPLPPSTAPPAAPIPGAPAYAPAPPQAQVRTKPVDLAPYMFIPPLLGTLLLWFLPLSYNAVYVVAWGAVILCTVLVAVEAGLAGMKYDRQKGTYGPVSWVFLLLLLWAVMFPIYMYKRRNYGLTNQLVAGLVTSVIFTLSLIIYTSMYFGW